MSKHVADASDANGAQDEVMEEAPDDRAEAASAEAAEASSHEVAEAVERLQQELDLTKDQLLRQVAEFQNVRRRLEKERGQQVQLAQGRVIQPLLDVLDDFRRSLDAAEQVEEQQDETASPAYLALKEGVSLVYQKFSDELKKLGVEAIPAEGEPFDEHVHEALMQQPAPEGVEPGTVLQELQRGYRMGDRVLRHAKVAVAS